MTEALGAAPLFDSHRDLLATIDAIKQGEQTWEHFSIRYNGVLPDNPPSWMTEGDESFGVWFREPLNVLHEMIANPELQQGFEYAPFREWHQNGSRVYRNFMSGNFSWRQAVSISSFILVLRLTDFHCLS